MASRPKQFAIDAYHAVLNTRKRAVKKIRRALNPRREFTEIAFCGRNLRFHTPNDHALGRVISKFSRDDDLNQWLSAIRPDEILWDIGANVGTVSIYAAVKTGCHAVAFEPGAANYAGLNANIELNGLSDKIEAYCLAIADKNGFEKFYMPSTDEGQALSNYGSAIDQKLKPFVPKFVQGAVGMTVDHLAQSLPFPNYIKIDVDGIDEQVLQGAQATLRDTRVKSLRVEGDMVRPELEGRYIALLPGFALTAKARGGMVWNYTFTRP